MSQMCELVFGYLYLQQADGQIISHLDPVRFETKAKSKKPK